VFELLARNDSKTTMTKLQEILDHKRGEVEKAKKKCSLEDVRSNMAMKPSVSLKRSLESGEVGIIGEVKKASPSRGVMVEDFEPVKIAKTYETCGLNGVSVLTDEKYFQGHLRDLKEVKKNISLPVLRKDFIIDPYQVYESKAAGADAVLLIVRCLTDARLTELFELAHTLDLETLVEVHSKGELDRANDLAAPIIGINNRNLDDFTVDIRVSKTLFPKVHQKALVVSESGIKTKEDFVRLRQLGIKAFLIGEGFVTHKDMKSFILELKGT